MLKSIIKYRPSNLCAVYVEPQRIEVLHAHRHWRAWEIGVTEQFRVPSGESVFDHLQYLNLRPKGKKGSALLVIVSSALYSVHSEHYPLSIKDQLDDSINFDWQENIFQENDRTLHFSGPPIALDQHVSVPIFSIQREIYDKLHQSLNGMLFQTFAVAPSALSFSALLPLVEDAGEESEIVARCLDDDSLEAHCFYRGAFLETEVVGKSSQSLKLFGESLKCAGDSERKPHIHLVCAPGERQYSGKADAWLHNGFAVKVRETPEPLVATWLNRLLKQDDVAAFGSSILLKPWQIPRIAAPLAALVLIFALYGFIESRWSGSMAQTSKNLKVQISQLEARWKPIEEIQTRIAKFQEDQKTLSEFSREDYQLLGLLNFLTQITPDETWINYLSLRKGQLILRGESKSALKYLAELSKADGLTDVKLASPVTKDPGTDLERFNIQLQLDMEKLKKSLDTLPPETPAGVDSTPKTPASEKRVIEGAPPATEEESEGPPEQGQPVEEQPDEGGRQ